MIILWLLLMGLFVAYLAVPMARWLGWEYGRFGRVGDTLLIVSGTLLGGVVLVAFLGLLGQFTIGDAGAIGLVLPEHWSRLGCSYCLARSAHPTSRMKPVTSRLLHPLMIPKHRSPWFPPKTKPIRCSNLPIFSNRILIDR